MSDEEIIYLDLEKVTLYGWEEENSIQTVDAIIRGIEAGDDFPAVPVYKIDEHEYWLDPNYLTEKGDAFNPLTDGGHSRACGHYIEGKPLKCKLMHDIMPYFMRSNMIPIQRIILDDNPEDYKVRKKIFPDYR